ncbi:unnamed protein product [Acanthosepion pharaonis]|uniref:Uncharacterized protein n=1 Tax=Acanthosepion pharaonis TaxID=158019 RepID=A0A812B8U7_ACAPH|nr:unnamed protein product [Sepia pharaonis]
MVQTAVSVLKDIYRTQHFSPAHRYVFAFFPSLLFNNHSFFFFFQASCLLFLKLFFSGISLFFTLIHSLSVYLSNVRFFFFSFSFFLSLPFFNTSPFPSLLTISLFYSLNFSIFQSEYLLALFFTFLFSCFFLSFNDLSCSLPLFCFTLLYLYFFSVFLSFFLLFSYISFSPLLSPF